MAFDAFFLHAVLEEIRENAQEARVDKIHQPSRDTVILQLKCRQGRQKLLFALNPTAPRLHLTNASPENPAEPPMFCMLLRKHLLGARLMEITQLPMERCAIFTFDCIDEMGDHVNKKLVAELMGRTCNLYLLSPEGRILDCLRRIGLDESIKRAALPGLTCSLSVKIFCAKSVKAFKFSCSDFFIPEDSGINSKAPIPRLPMNDNKSKGVIS